MELPGLIGTLRHKPIECDAMHQGPDDATDQQVRGSNPFVRTRNSTNPRSLTWGFVFPGVVDSTPVDS